MTFPYITENGHEVRCLCKGCGALLWRTYVEMGRISQEVTPEYGDLYLALMDSTGELSEHSTPCCPSCADRVIDGALTSELEEWWGADVFHWFVEERVRGSDPDSAYRTALKLQADRHVVRARRYVRGEPPR